MYAQYAPIDIVDFQPSGGIAQEVSELPPIVQQWLWDSFYLKYFGNPVGARSQREWDRLYSLWFDSQGPDLLLRYLSERCPSPTDVDC